MDFKDEEVSSVLAKTVGSLITGLIIVFAIKFSFFLTWPQSFVIAWLYCLLRDACLHSNR